ncbi:MAG: alpha-1,4-glucan--maltose-1-phosphate maltosyltransferase [Candidatus Goldbacteria bacterium]|nr:alpha-1,4-glucan--maltose-1-phosphate maltosyltransferase [Candidatus Goldiibacteriota bacterium]
MEGKKRVVIEKVFPEIDNGRFPIKRVIGEKINIKSHIISDGHDEKACFFYYKHENDVNWQKKEMKLLYNDEWLSEFVVEKQGCYFYTVKAWIDHFKTWQMDLKKRIENNQDVTIDLLIGIELIEKTISAAEVNDAKKLSEYMDKIRKNDKNSVETALSNELAGIMQKYPEQDKISEYEKNLMVYVDREKAGFSTWFEMFPRSCYGNSKKHGTFMDCEKILPEIAKMGFNVLYFPPIHPIGVTKRKGKNNSLTAGPDDPGSPWAIGSKEGGHKSIHPELGNFEDFDRLIKKAEELDIEIAIDIAFQCSPDHPYVKEHPEWFKWRPDKTIQYAENPPKKYEDIVHFNFECNEWKELWEELKSIFIFWAEKGIKIFRVDNPHTKPFPFWEWVIPEVKKQYPDVIFLSEAFTRPKIMYRLSKAGFTQSYTYFAWRNSRYEMEEYMKELTQTEVSEFFRPNFWPNTPDILHEYLQKGGRAAFVTRLVLAATLSSNYGIYGPAYILCMNEPFPGKEEYNNNEKYEIKYWNLDLYGNLKPEITRINQIRKDNKALQSNRNFRILGCDNPQIIAYAKATDDHTNVVMTVVNFDTYHKQSAWVEIPFDWFGISQDDEYEVADLFNDVTYKWKGHWNFVILDPQITQAHVLIFKK